MLGSPKTALQELVNRTSHHLLLCEFQCTVIIAADMINQKTTFTKLFLIVAGSVIKFTADSTSSFNCAASWLLSLKSSLFYNGM
jgi:hypothetical protein